jgi:hypothetical protein
MICNASAAVALVVHWHLMSTVAENRLGRVLTCQYFNYQFQLFVLTSSFCVCFFIIIIIAFIVCSP